MVTGTEQAPAPATQGADGGDVPSAGQIAGRRWKASRSILAAALAVIVLALGLAALRPSGSAQAGDPESPTRRGTRALAEILRGHGTPVRVSRDTGDAAASATAGTVLIITRSERLTRSDIARLQGVQADLLLVKPTRDVLEGLAPGVEKAGDTYEETAEPGCPLQAATLAGRVHFGDSDTYTAPAGGTACYRDRAETDSRVYRLVQVRAGDRTITVLGSGTPFTNERLDEEGDAALGMNLAGARSSVVWLIPDLPEPGSGSEEKTLTGLLPLGVKLFFLQLVIGVVLLALWRARRLGPVVAEALPVVVRSAETVEGRARLYRAHRARGSAAEALRAGTRERLVPLLGLPRSAADDPASAREIVTAVAQRTTYDEAMVGVALYGPEPTDDGRLVGLSDLLDDLERQVRTS